MRIEELCKGWTMREEGAGESLPASVPGSVYNDLLINQKMEDPYFRDNELSALRLMEKDYEYATRFSVSEELLSEEKVLLKFHGIDTVADICLNGVQLGHVENMHRTWEFPVKSLLSLRSHGMFHRDLSE